jgi:putative acetyltransferase
VIVIRREQPGDEESVRLVNLRAFGQPAEAQIVDALRKTCPEEVAFVAEDNGRIVGHILFTPASIDAQEGEIRGMGLAPMAVLPEYQRQGIGSLLVQAGLAEMRRTRRPFVIVLGHPGYYPRFGFTPASGHGIVCQYPNVPDEAFMILALDEAALQGVAGVARYRPEFAAAV